jgi:hypothetical protein
MADELKAQLDALVPRIATLEEKDAILAESAGRIPPAVTRELIEAAVEKSALLQVEIDRAKENALTARASYEATLQRLADVSEEACSACRMAEYAKRGGRRGGDRGHPRAAAQAVQSGVIRG